MRGMSVLLLEGLALELVDEGGQHEEMSGREDACGWYGVASFAAGVDALHDLDGGDEGGGGEVFEGVAIGEQALFDVEALRLEGAEDLLDDPAAAIEFDHEEGLLEGGDLVCGVEAPVHGGLAGGRVGLAYVDEAQGELGGIGRIGAGPGLAQGDLAEADLQGDLAGWAAGAGVEFEVGAPATGQVSILACSRPACSPSARSWWQRISR
jgi:hypothetical protein